VLLFVLVWFPSAHAWEALEACGGGFTAWPAGEPNTVWQLSTSFPSADLSADEVSAAVDAAFAEWGKPGCSEFDAQRGPDVAADPLAQDGIFSVGFYEDGWPASLGVALAVTTWLSNGSCDITEADIAFRGTDVLWVADGWISHLETDVQSVATHEVGHWLGFGHDDIYGSPMDTPYSNTRIERTLTCHNTEGVCTLYPAPGDSCTQDRYCACGVGCNDGICAGDPAENDQEDLFEPGPCTAEAIVLSEEEPNDELYGPQYLSPVEGNIELSGSLASCGNGLEWSGDLDRVVLDMNCEDELNVTLDWPESAADLDFWVDGLDEDGEWVSVAGAVEWGAPPAWDSGVADVDLAITIACWEGAPSDWTLNVYFGPPPESGDDDDDDDDHDDDDDDQPPEGQSEGECSDGLDNDADGARDCLDPDCADFPECESEEGGGPGDGGVEGCRCTTADKRAPSPHEKPGATGLAMTLMALLGLCRVRRRRCHPLEARS